MRNVVFVYFAMIWMFGSCSNGFDTQSDGMDTGSKYDNESVYNDTRTNSNGDDITIMSRNVSTSFTIPSQGGSVITPKKIGNLTIARNSGQQVTLKFSSGNVKEIRIYRENIFSRGPLNITKITNYESVPVSTKSFTLNSGNTSYWKVLSTDSGDIGIGVIYRNSNTIKVYSIAFTITNNASSSGPVFEPSQPTGGQVSGTKLSSIPPKYQGTYTAKTGYGTGTIKLTSNGIECSGIKVEVDVADLDGSGYSTISTISGNSTSFSTITETSYGELWLKVIFLDWIHMIILAPRTITFDVNINSAGLVVSNVIAHGGLGVSNKGSSIVYKRVSAPAKPVETPTKDSYEITKGSAYDLDHIGSSSTDEVINPYLDKAALLRRGYTKAKISISFRYKAKSIWGGKLRLQIANSNKSAELSRKEFSRGMSWGSSSYSTTIDITSLNSSCQFMLLWSKNGSSKYCVGTRTISIKCF
jgi:hypothetical protein